MSLRVGYLTGEYPRATDTFIQREVNALRAQGVFVRTFSVRRTGSEHDVGPEQSAERRGTICLLPPKPRHLLAFHLLEFLRSPGRYCGCLRKAWRMRAPGVVSSAKQAAYFLEAGLLAGHIRRAGLDHLHNHFADSSCTVGLLAAQLAEVPFSFTVHGPAIWFNPDRWCLPEKVAGASFVACISRFCLSQAMIFSRPEHWSRLQIVHCGVETARYSPRVHSRPVRRVTCVGRLAPVKGLHVLLDAFASLEWGEVELALVGDGPMREELSAKARSLGVESRVRITGFLSQAEVANELQQSDVFCLPSFAEGVPVVLMEAMASGLPVVATRIAGIPELVADGKSGLLVTPGDPDALARALSLLLGDEQMRTRMGRAGREFVMKEFSSMKEARKLLKALGDSVERAKSMAVDG